MALAVSVTLAGLGRWQGVRIVNWFRLKRAAERHHSRGNQYTDKFSLMHMFPLLGKTLSFAQIYRAPGESVRGGWQDDIPHRIAITDRQQVIVHRLETANSDSRHSSANCQDVTLDTSQPQTPGSKDKEFQHGISSGVRTNCIAS